MACSAWLPEPRAIAYRIDEVGKHCIIILFEGGDHLEQQCDLGHARTLERREDTIGVDAPARRVPR